MEDMVYDMGYVVKKETKLKFRGGRGDWGMICAVSM